MSDENPMTHPLAPDAAPDSDGPVRIDASPDGSVMVTMDRPRDANRMTQALVGALREAFETLHGADHTRIVFLRGAGGIFCAGRDPEWMRDTFDWTDADLRDDAFEMARMLKALRDIPAFTVALVEGEAVGPGLGLVAACDMALAAPGARFGFPELRIGLLPSVTAPYVVDAIGPRQTQALFGAGRLIDARTALRVGLVQALAADVAQFSALQEQLAKDATACAPQAAVEFKRISWRLWGRPLDHALMEDTARRFAAQCSSEEGVEGLQAFLDERPPSWNA